MKKKSNLFLLLQRVIVIMILFSICRLLFLLFNFSYFSDEGFLSLLSAFFYGLRFDVTAVVICNLPFLFFHFFPFSFFYRKSYQGFLKFLFLLVNIPLLLLNCIDLALFRFAGKRATADVIKIMSFGDDFTNAVPKMVADFWYILLLFFLLTYLLLRLYNRIHWESPANSTLNKWMNMRWVRPFLHLLMAGLVFVGFRGGVQFRPINILTASQYGTGQITALVLNTPFTVIKSYGKGALQELHYFSDEEAGRVAPVLHSYAGNGPFQPLNVVVIILESFGKEYIGSLNNTKGYTPFLDSLIGKSMVFTNAYANGKRSIEGIPAILAGIPALMQEPYITSAYAGNALTALGTVLKEKGYSTSFFHGGTNGTMGFDNFSKMAGFSKYFGRKEYNNDADFDGSWGIFDEPFLQRFCTELSATKEPFATVLFTISSHHPYTLPKREASNLPKGSLPIHQSIRYADFALEQFFNSASQKPWYPNTLFVITADHTALSEKSFYQNRVGMYAVPLIFFRPDGSLHGRNSKTAQQIDILPSVLNYLHYDKPFFAFGSSVFDTTADGHAVNFINDNYQLIQEGYTLLFDTLDKNKLFNFSADSTLQSNLFSSDTVHANQMERKMKAIIQQFNHAMVMNQMKTSPLSK